MFRKDGRRGRMVTKKAKKRKERRLMSDYTIRETTAGGQVTA